jgi:hypothetical protein
MTYTIANVFDDILDDFVTSRVYRKINIKNILKLYSSTEVLQYYNSSNYKMIQQSCEDLLSDDEYMLSAYNLFNTNDKRNYIKIIIDIINNVNSATKEIQTEKYKSIRYLKNCTYSGNTFTSLQPVDLIDAKLSMFFDTNTNTLFIVSGASLSCDKNGSLTGIDDIHYKKTKVPYIILNDIQENNYASILDSAIKSEDNKFKINKYTIIVKIVY